MSDFADHGAEAADYMLTVALRQQEQRAAATPIPMCEECREREVHVTAMGTRFRYCPDCTYDLTGRKV